MVAAGARHSFLLKSDGTVAACGSNIVGQCTIPALDEGLHWMKVGQARSLLVLQLTCTQTANGRLRVVGTLLSGEESFRLESGGGESVATVLRRIAHELGTGIAGFRAILPDGRHLNGVNQSASISNIFAVGM